MRKVVFAAALVAVLAAGCTEKQAGSPTSRPESTETPTGTSSSPPTDSSGAGAPKVGDPLNASKFVGQPCTTLTAGQVQPFNLPTQGKPDTDSDTAKRVGPGCSWFNRDTGSGVSVNLLTGNKNGLSDTYRGRAQFKGYFEPTEVDGYPAVLNDIIDYRSDGTCNLVVGASDTLAFLVTVQDTQLGQKSCDRTKEFASLVIKNMKGA